ncbi:uncharacterized protein LOC134231670 [Saccostrea cucullata]|uniref:uncharacterized protein LOC134231670 n=1 Tax=Saccostrea cuccullata TaxID=36930 RepID=UPI002ED2E489
MNKDTTTQIKVLQCCQCQRDVEFYCRPCEQNFCMPCKQEHVVYLDTKDHDVVIYRLKHGDFITPELCDIHPDCKYKSWCKSCECLICDKNDKHQEHEILDIKLACTIQREEHKERIIQIRGESLPHSRAILAGLKSDVKKDVKILKAQFSSIHQKLTAKAENLKKLIDRHRKTLNDKPNTYNTYTTCILKHQKMKEYVQSYTELANKPVKFLLLIKKTPVPKAIEFPINIMFRFLNEISIRDMNDILDEVKITEAGKRKVKKEQMLKLVQKGLLKKFVAVTDLIHGVHISFVTPDKIWVSDRRSLILTNSKGNILHHFYDVNKYYGVHTVNNVGELIYVDKDWNINKLSADNTTKSTLIQRIELWEPWCICHSSSTEDLLVMMRYDTRNLTINSEVKVIRFNDKVQPVQTIQYDSSDQQLYSEPIYIIENRNGDVIVSDAWSGLVVTYHNGKYRFTYRGPPKGSALGFFMPHGTCVDTFLNILICSRLDQTIHMIDKDGHLLSILSILPTKQDGMVDPLGMGYDEKNHLVWMGSVNNNILYAYRYIERQDYLADIS